MASPAITNIVPLEVEFTPEGVLLRLVMLAKGLRASGISMEEVRRRADAAAAVLARELPCP